MGICSSCESISVATAKLILQDGQLVEFPYSIKVSYVLQKYPSSFICDSDSMEFDNFISAMHVDEELLLGHLYFALPLCRLRFPLQAEEMAALAVKASSALMKIRGGGAYECAIKSTNETVNSKKQQKRLTDGRGVGKKSSGSIGKGSRQNFPSSKSKLTIIPESE